MPAARTPKTNPGQVVTMELERTTKNAVRYAEEVENGKEPHIGIIYIKKALYDKLGEPEVIEVTVKAAEE